MFCRNCGEKLSKKQVICIKCGVPIGDGTAYCAKCGKSVNENQEVCLGCGHKIKSKKSGTTRGYNLNGQSKVAMAVICLFLGIFGVHNFIMGEKKKGIRKIMFYFIFGLSIILALIDFFKIITNQYTAIPD